jgi:hypothetical protein
MLLIERLTRPWNERQIGRKASDEQSAVPYTDQLIREMFDRQMSH